MASQNAAAPSRLIVAATVTFYLIAALAMVMANKWVLNTTDTPLFFLFAQLVIAVVLFTVCGTTGLLKLKIQILPIVCKGVAPLVAVNVMGLSFNNYTLKYVDASFYQVARGLVLPFTVVTSAIFLRARPSLRVLLACGAVTAGFFVGVLLDNRKSGGPSMLGITFGLLSSVTTALNAVIIKRSLDYVDGSALALAWYTNVLSALLLAPCIFIVGEGPGISALIFGQDSSGALRTFVWGTMVTGVFGFLICIAGFLSIKITSPITHMVSSAVRGVLATLLGVWLFGDVVTSGRASSIAIIVLGSVYYTWVKHEESLQLRESPRPPAYEPVPLEERDLESSKSAEAKD